MDDAFAIVKRPLVTEKNMARAETRGIYTFEVGAEREQDPDPARDREAVQGRRRRRPHLDPQGPRPAAAGMGYKTKDADIKKAIVTLKKGDKIDIL